MKDIQKILPHGRWIGREYRYKAWSCTARGWCNWDTAEHGDNRESLIAALRQHGLIDSPAVTDHQRINAYINSKPYIRIPQLTADLHLPGDIGYARMLGKMLRGLGWRRAYSNKDGVCRHVWYPPYRSFKAKDKHANGMGCNI